MSSYDYYRTTYPGWGQSQLQFRGPPAPVFQPLPSWSGWDYYRAHAYNPDYNLYSDIVNRVRASGYTGGFSVSEAKAWQRRVYSGIINLAEMLPGEIGAAAAYEAYRMWKHHREVLFDPLGGSMERERDALIGLAIGEASRLWAYSGRPMDTYGQRDCLESAASTTANIAYTIFDDRGRSRDYGRGYAYEDPYAPRRGRRYSNASQLAMQPNGSPYGGAAPLPMPGAGVPGYAGSAPYGGGIGGSPYLGGGGVPAYAESAGSYGGRGYAGSTGSYGSTGGHFPAPLSRRRSPSPFMQPPAAVPSPFMGAAQPGYAGSGGYGAPQQYAQPGYGGGGAYPQPGYGYGQPQSEVYTTSGTTTIPAPPGSTIVITKGRRRGSGSHHHHDHGISGIRRARSADMRRY